MKPKKPIKKLTLKQRFDIAYQTGVNAGRIQNQQDVDRQMQRETHAQRMEIMRTSSNLVSQAGQTIQTIGDVLKNALIGGDRHGR